jgi:hypothetical protein
MVLFVSARYYPSGANLRKWRVSEQKDSPGISLEVSLSRHSMADISFGSAVVLFAVNILFTARLVRGMHPALGWNPIFKTFSRILAFSVPTVVILNILALSFMFFSPLDTTRFEGAEKLLKFGLSWNMFLSVYPVITLLIVSMLPVPIGSPPPEQFGYGPLRIKVAMVAYASTTLSVGAAIRLAALLNPQPADNTAIIFSREVFYTVGFTLEILIVALFAVGRIDLRFHVPNGSSRPGDYSRRNRSEKSTDDEDSSLSGGSSSGDSSITVAQIERKRKTNLGTKSQTIRTQKINRGLEKPRDMRYSRNPSLGSPNSGSIERLERRGAVRESRHSVKPVMPSADTNITVGFTAFVDPSKKAYPSPPPAPRFSQAPTLAARRQSDTSKINLYTYSIVPLTPPIPGKALAPVPSVKTAMPTNRISRKPLPTSRLSLHPPLARDSLDIPRLPQRTSTLPPRRDHPGMISPLPPVPSIPSASNPYWYTRNMATPSLRG